MTFTIWLRKDTSCRLIQLQQRTPYPGIPPLTIVRLQPRSKVMEPGVNLPRFFNIGKYPSFPKKVNMVPNSFDMHKTILAMLEAHFDGL